MYTEHFGLNEKPFSISPDPRYLYLSPRHADALAHLLYGISESGGFIQLTGEVGTGKTTLIRSLLGQLPDNAEIALILNPQLSSKQFLQAICHELRIPFVTRETAKSLIDKLNFKLLESHADNRRVVLIVDEAQTMSLELLEQVRLLTNLETEKRKLLQIILIGQPELREILGRSDMRQIAQRITGRYHLEPLNAADTAVYIAHRMKVAGGRPKIFSKRAVRRLFRLSRGVPRLINIVADRALLAAYSRDESRIGPRLVGRAANEVFGRSRKLGWWPWVATATGLALLLTGVVIEDGNRSADALEVTLAEADAPSTGTAAPASEPETERATEIGIESASPGLASLAAVLAAGESSADATRSALFTLWGADYSATAADACAQAETQQLRCLTLRNSSLGELRALNRPVDLELLTGDGQTHHLLLAGLGEKHAIVWAGDTMERIDIADLTLFTFGEQLLLFRPAIQDAPGSLSEGARGPGVIWLRTSLESVFDRSLPSDEPDLFDAALTAAVEEYQRIRGLFVDGVVGDRTLINLQTDIGLFGVSLKTGMH
jgi:general secretion pathway protein A